MSTEEVPAFSHGGDEVAEGEDAEPNPTPFDLASWMDDKERVIGFAGSVEYMNEDGDIIVEHVLINVDPYKAIGFHDVAKREILDLIDTNVYSAEG